MTTLNLGRFAGSGVGNAPNHPMAFVVVASRNAPKAKAGSIDPAF